MKNNKGTKRAQKRGEQEESFLKKVSFVGVVLTVIELGASTILLQKIFSLGVLPSYANILVSAIIIALLIFTGYKSVCAKTQTRMRIACTILSVILIALYTYAAYSLNSTIKVLKTLTTGASYEKQEYSIVVLKDSTFQTIESLQSATIAFRSTNPNSNLAKEALQEFISYLPVDCEEVGSMIGALENNNAAAAVIASSYLSTLEEEHEEYYEELRVIYTFEIEYEIGTNNEAAVDVATEPFIIYISGSDSRTTISNTDRSDVNILAVVNPQKGKVLLVSIPRDYYVQLHGTTGTKDKLTHAGIYGIDMSKQTIQDLLDININYTVRIGFTAVEEIVDQVDGVDIYSDTAFTRTAQNSDEECKIIKGTQHLDGACALVFARERYSYASSDRHRGQNQQAVITALIQKISQPKYAIQYTDILTALGHSFTTNMTYDDITSFAKMQLTTLQTWEVESISLDGTDAMKPTYSMGSQKLYVMIPDESTITNAKTKINKILEK